tara:strand:- start:865 stop:1194 length:330 start_codon:yes stop_codon:yes gene_type:complete
MNLSNFTENELETISLSMDDYINYDDESLSNDELIGGQSVSDRVTSIQNKIDSYFILKNQIRDTLLTVNKESEGESITNTLKVLLDVVTYDQLKEIKNIIENDYLIDVN